MIHRYFSLSEKASLDKTRLIWIIDSNWIKIPDGQLTLLFDFYISIDKKSGLFLNDIFGTFESSYIELDDEGEVVINLPKNITNKCLALLKNLQQILENKEEELMNIYVRKYELVYYNSEYINMIKALINILQEALKLNENIETWLDH